jgi:hypothetical protein
MPDGDFRASDSIFIDFARYKFIFTITISALGERRLPIMLRGIRENSPDKNYYSVAIPNEHSILLSGFPYMGKFG